MKAPTNSRSRRTQIHLSVLPPGLADFLMHERRVVMSVYRIAAARMPSTAPYAPLTPRRVLVLLTRR
jgi:hypothetical protein